MTYTMHNPFGDAEEVHRLERAYEICADFVRVVQITLDQIDAAESNDYDAFPNSDIVSENWDHNAAIVKQMEANPQLLLTQKKAQYRRMMLAILEMAEACSLKLPTPE